MSRRVIFSTAAYGVGNALVAAGPLVLTPLYVRKFSPHDFGTFTLFNTLVALAVPIVGVAAGASVQRRFFDLDRETFGVYLGSCALLVTAGLAFCAALVFLVGEQIGAAIAFPSQWLWPVVAAAAGVAIQQLLLVSWQCDNQAKTYVLFQSTTFSISMLLPIVFVAVLDWGWHGAALGVVLSQLVAAAAALWFLRSRFCMRLTKDWSHVKHALRFGLPLVPHLIAGWTVGMADRLLIAMFWGLDRVAIYALAFQAAQVVSLTSASINQAYAPWLFGTLSEGDASKTRIVFNFGYACAGLIAIVGVVVVVGFTFAVPLFLEQRYIESIPVAQLLLAAFVFNGCYRLAANILLYAERTAEIAVTTFVCAAAAVTMNWILIPDFGVIAAGWTSLLVFSLLSAWTILRASYVRRR